MKPRISIRLFDRLAVHCGDRELRLPPSRDAQEILCYLIVNRRASVPRETLAGLISSSSRTKRSKRALRQALWRLRDSLRMGACSFADRVLRPGSGWVQFVSDPEVWVDVDEFERASAHRKPALLPEDLDRLAKAVDLYRGDLLQSSYQQWCLDERERLRQIYLNSLDSLVVHCEASGDLEGGMTYANRALRADPTSERAYRALMRLYLALGDRTSAMRCYERCVRTLHDELGVEPDSETRKLENVIRSGNCARRSIGGQGPRGSP